MKEYNEKMYDSMRAFVSSGASLLLFIYEIGTTQDIIFLFVTGLLCLGSLRLGLKSILIKGGEAQ